MSDWASFPKTELHLHIEGAAPPAFIRTLAAEQNVDLSRIFAEDGSYVWQDFAEFLRTYEAACEVLRGPDEFRRLTTAILEEQKRHGVVYTEFFISPDMFGDGGSGAWNEYFAALVEGTNAVEGITARFISTAIRHFGAEAAVKAAQITVNAPHPMLTGFGMGGEERHLMPIDFAPAFARTHEAGLGITCHAGEICGADMVRATLDALPVTRIGHGVRAIEDPDLVLRLADENIMLEVNPGSNIALNVFESWPDHPIAKLKAAGVPVTISTDDPPYFHTDMSREYAMLDQTFGWGKTEFDAVNQIALAHAFCDDDTKAHIATRL